MQHDAARSKRISLEEMPVDQPMRPAARREISRNPSTDQKKQRRQQMRKSAGDMAIGHVQCQSCGYEGTPVLGDTGKACRNCNSYSVSPQKRAVPGPDNSRYLERGDYGRTAKVDFDQCGYCGVENALVKDGLCPRHEHMRNDGREDDDSWQSQDDHEYYHGSRKTASAWDAGSVSDECLKDGLGCDGGDCSCSCHGGRAPDFQSAKDVADYHANDPHSYYKTLRDQHGTWDEHHERRRQSSKTATVLDARAENLNPNDQISTPNGRTQRVVRVRPHENSANHVYVDTDGGTALVERTAPFKVVPKNSQQQSLPGYGTPGANSNHLPGDRAGGDNAAPTTKCPQCGGPGTLRRQGDGYSCSRCGYKEQFGGAGGHAFSDSPSTVRTFSTVNRPLSTAVARRAAALLNQSEETS